MHQATEWLKRIQGSDKLPVVIIGAVACAFTLYCCFGPPMLGTGAGDSGLPIPVLLATALPGEALNFAVEGPYKVFGGTRLRDYREGGHLYSGLRLKNAQIYRNPLTGLMVNGKPVPGTTVQIIPQRDGDLERNDRRYSGTFFIRTNENGKLLLFNHLDLEDYLAGVIFKEMPASFETEALKAQLIAARSYAVHRILSGAEYLTDDTRSQVYGGLESVSAKSRALVEETRGEVLVYEDAILPAFYGSTCGGTTARARDVFGGEAPAPVDQSRLCGYCTASPTYRWRTSFTFDEIRQRLELVDAPARFDVGITAWDSMRRAREISIMDQQNGIIARIPSGTFRTVMNQGRSLKESILSTLIEVIERDENGIRIKGRGWGHGVGLCQYGAQGLALKGKSFKKILEYYYPEARIVNNYNGLIAGEDYNASGPLFE